MLFRSRSSEVRAAEHRDAGGRTLQRPQRGTQAVGAYYRAWCAPTNQSPNPITSLISHYPTLTPVTRITTPTLRPPTRRGHVAARNPTHAPLTQLTHSSINSSINSSYNSSANCRHHQRAHRCWSREYAHLRHVLPLLHQRTRGLHRQIGRAHV